MNDTTKTTPLSAGDAWEKFWEAHKLPDEAFIAPGYAVADRIAEFAQEYALASITAMPTRAGADDGDETECGLVGGECPAPALKCHYCERYQALKKQISMLTAPLAPELAEAEGVLDAWPHQFHSFGPAYFEEARKAVRTLLRRAVAEQPGLPDCVRCQDTRKSGFVDSCTACSGTGQVPTDEYLAPCGACGGTGSIAEKCPYCADKPTPRTCSNCGFECIYQKAGPGADTPCAFWKEVDRPTQPKKLDIMQPWELHGASTPPAPTDAEVRDDLRRAIRWAEMHDHDENELAQLSVANARTILAALDEAKEHEAEAVAGAHAEQEVSREALNECAALRAENARMVEENERREEIIYQCMNRLGMTQTAIESIDPKLRDDNALPKWLDDVLSSWSETSKKNAAQAEQIKRLRDVADAAYRYEMDDACPDSWMTDHLKDAGYDMSVQAYAALKETSK